MPEVTHNQVSMYPLEKVYLRKREFQLLSVLVFLVLVHGLQYVFVVPP